MNVLVTGGEGALGSYCDFGKRLGRNDLDVTNLSAVMKICAEYRPSAIVHCAALTNLLFCEQHPDTAYMVNAAGTYHMALGARSIGAKLVYVSTSDVFDGNKGEPYVEKDTPNPTTAYGRSKHLGELAVQGFLDDYVILRISWVFGGGPEKDTKFVGKLLSQKDPAEFRAVTDRKASPSWGKDLASAMRKLIEEDARGVYHVGGGVATRYDIAVEIANIMGWKAKILPAAASEFPSPYPIGKDQSMPQSPLVRPWREALKEYIETEW